MKNVMLAAHDAAACPRRIQNEFTIPAPLRSVVDPRSEVQAAGHAFKEHILGILADAFPDSARPPRLGGSARGWGDTFGAMERGTPIILDGSLPMRNGRVGRPPVLVKMGTGKYLPATIRNRSSCVTTSGGTATVSTLNDPMRWIRVPGLSSYTRLRRFDGFPLAHYTRMLQDLGFHPGTPDEAMLRGGVIGTHDFSEDPAQGALAFVWHDLSAETEYLQQRPDGFPSPMSMMAAYDIEFASRLAIANAAKRGQGDVRPLHQPGCSECPFLANCREVVGPSEPSFAMPEDLLSREQWEYLYEHGGDTLEGLAHIGKHVVTRYPRTGDPHYDLWSAVMLARTALWERKQTP